MQTKTLHRVLIVIICLVVVRGLMYGLVIPFDRAPDEKHHFKLIKAKHLQLAQASSEEQRHAAARLELAWYYLLYPESNPHKRSVQDYAGLRLPSPPSSWRIYYLFSAWVLNIASLETIQEEIYLLRGLSIFCGTLVVLLSFLLVRELFPDHTFMVLGVPLFITFIPQFSAMNGSLNNDKFPEVFIALLFVLLVKILKRGLHWHYAIAGLFVLVGAQLGKRTATFLFPLLLVFLFVYFWKSSLGLRMHLILIGCGLGLLFLGTVAILHVDLLREVFKNHIIWASPDKVKAFMLQQSYTPENLVLYAKFFIVIYWSFWGVFGYMTIHLHHGWYLAAALAQILSIGGLVKFVWLSRREERLLEPWKAKTLYVFAVSILFAVIIMFLRSIVLRPGDPVLTQGRYLFTVVIPISILTLWGLQALVPPRYHRMLGACGLAGLIVLDMVCLSKYLLLNFHALSWF